MSAATIPVSFSLTPDLVGQLDAVAAAGDRSRSATIRRILRDAFADHAALHRIAGERFASLQTPSAPLSEGPLPHGASGIEPHPLNSVADSPPAGRAAVPPARSAGGLSRKIEHG